MELNAAVIPQHTFSKYWTVPATEGQRTKIAELAKTNPIIHDGLNIKKITKAGATLIIDKFNVKKGFQHNYYAYNQRLLPENGTRSQIETIVMLCQLNGRKTSMGRSRLLKELGATCPLAELSFAQADAVIKALNARMVDNKLS